MLRYATLLIDCPATPANDIDGRIAEFYSPS